MKYIEWPFKPTKLVTQFKILNLTSYMKIYKSIYGTQTKNGTTPLEQTNNGTTTFERTKNGTTPFEQASNAQTSLTCYHLTLF